ncbi:YihY/virulence factor BrkB family protein [Microbacterium sp.]|uniref:YihY/virulence factor BrkB family protein n=1 Tax=Microbacterium sp. TaxID=51671 RepID=UPI0039E52FC5
MTARDVATGSADRSTGPIARAGAITQRTLASFPVRVWRHFLDHSGFLLAAGVSYQAMFAVFAVMYVAFAAAGIWLGASPSAIQALIDGINSYIPGIISDEGLFRSAQVVAIASGARRLLVVTGAVAFIVAMWTAIGFISFARRAVRTMLVLPPDRRNVLVLKLRDLVAAVVLAVALVLGFAVGSAGTWALGTILAALGWDTHEAVHAFLIAVASVGISYVVYTLTLAALLRFLTGTALGWRLIRTGSLLAAAGITLLQLATGYLLGAVPRTPLLATFAVFVGLLIWFQVTGVFLLSAAAWIAVSARDSDIPLLTPSEEERRLAAHEARVRAARDRLRAARDARAATPWWRALRADRAVRDALDELFLLEASAPPSRE